MNIFERYIGKNIITGIIISLIFLLSVASLANFVGQLGAVGRGTYTLSKAFLYTALNIPQYITIFFPIAALLGTLINLGNLAAGSEIIVMQSAGLSKFQIGLAVIKTSIPLIIIALVLGQWGVPQANFAANTLKIDSVLNVNTTHAGNLWEKNGNNFVYIGYVNNQNLLQNVRSYTYNPKTDKVVRETIATDVVRQHNAWVMQNITKYDITNTNVTRQHIAQQIWQFKLTPQDLSIAVLTPNELSITHLYQYSNYLTRTKQNARWFNLTFWQRLAAPLSEAVMLLLGVSFMFGSTRGMPIGGRIFIGVLIGFAFYVVNSVAGLATLVYGVPGIISAFLPSILVFLVAVWLLTKK